ncbi:MAG: 2-amino-4-hydroxy-6-hydroxymethyldihydropteridine diphosphokinase [Microcella sp.]|uniref:2-amino-4-hydroxy-6- hydroxymethyldihydropteridine diphosphokinase n=1 Tax=Microcella sp. TaxID=1913979 RepID=UPI00331515F0
MTGHEPHSDDGTAVDAVVALGANLGERAATLDTAVTELDRLPGTAVVGASRWHESVALTAEGLDLDKPAYLNGVTVLSTRLDPQALLRELRRIELAHGRDRSAAAPRWGDRTLDLDLIVHGDARLETPQLTLPHPRAHERDFVLRPWLEVRPEAVLPGRGPVAELLANLTESAVPAEQSAPSPPAGGGS